MNCKFEVAFSPEIPNLDSFEYWIQDLLAQYPLLRRHDAESVYKHVAQHDLIVEAAESCSSVKIGLLKTVCFEVIQKLDSQESNRYQFEQSIKVLFDDNNSDALSFCASVTRMLHQFRLSKTYEAREIIAEAYARGIKKIDSGSTIDVPLAWLRRTCLNVIRDFKRKQLRLVHPKFDPQPWFPGDSVYSEQILKGDLYTIGKAFEEMDLEDQELLYKRAIEGLSWQQIADTMVDDGSPMKAGTVRQRGARAIKRLRQIYKDLREDVIVPDELADSDGKLESFGTS